MIDSEGISFMKIQKKIRRNKPLKLKEINMQYNK